MMRAIVRSQERASTRRANRARPPRAAGGGVTVGLSLWADPSIVSSFGMGVGSLARIVRVRLGSIIVGMLARTRAVPLIAVLGTAMLATPLSGQEVDTVLTLDGARSLLGRNSPEYRAALAGADATGQGVWSAWGAMLPTASLYASFSRNEFTTTTFLDPTGVPQELEDPITDVSKSASQGLSFNWLVFDGGRKIFNIGTARAQARAADLSAVARLVQLQSQMEAQYFEALKQQQLARLAGELLAARRRDLEITQARFRIAAVAQTDVLQAEIQVGQQELAALQAEQAAVAARRELSALIGLEEELDYELRDTSFVFDPVLLESGQLVDLARRANPELARLDAAVDAQGRALWSARGTWLPSISLGLNLSRSEALGAEGSIFELTPRNTGQNFSISFSYPLFNGLEKKWRVGQESARLQEARHNLVAGRLRTEKEVRNAYDALQTGYRAVLLQQRNVELAREAVRLATERYRIGAAGFLELQSATTQATQAERGLIEARYEFMKSFARLEGAVGRPIEIDASGQEQ